MAPVRKLFDFENFNKKTAGAVLAVAAVFCFAFFAAARAEEDCVPNFVHSRYECGDAEKDGCKGTLKDIWCDTACGSGCTVHSQTACQGWQKCDAGKGSCACAGSCLAKKEYQAKNDRYYDKPFCDHGKPPDACGNNGPDDRTMPLKFDWENNALFGGAGNIQSYTIEIDNDNYQLQQEGEFKKVLPYDHFVSTIDGGTCFFNSSSEITWRVKPCCKADGTECGSYKDFKFSTTSAPELIAPYDADWVYGKCTSWIYNPTPPPQLCQNVLQSEPGDWVLRCQPFCVSNSYSFKGMQLRWCAAKLPAEYQTSDKVAYAKSYKLMVLSDEKEKNALKCHPLLSSTGKCKAEDVIVDPQLPDNSVVKYPEQSRQHFALFTRDRLYDWSVQTCFDDIAYKCGGGSQSWKFTTKIELIGVPGAVSPKNDPNGIEPVGLPLAITWTIPDGANSFVYQTSFLSGSKKVDWPTVPNEKMNANEKKLFDADNLKPDTEYKWRVKACAYFNSSDCDSWSEWFVFRTTGRPPKPETMKVEGNVPAIFSWEAVPGAKSYNFSLFKSSGETKTALLNDIEFLKNPKYTLGYPDIGQAQSYSWKVQTCAHSDGTVCGAWSGEKPFTASELQGAADLKPGAGSTVWADQVSQNISWGEVKGAVAYHYVLEFVSSAEKQECVQEKIDKIISRTSDVAELRCLGGYRLAVRPCADAGCESSGPESETDFVLSQHIPENKSAFALCGVGYDDPQTAWNDREACQPKHLLLLAKVFIDFLLFKLSVFLLPILALITGLIFYSPLGGQNIMEKIKMMWKAIGIGYALMIFAWIIVGILMQIAGFSGSWWRL